MTVSGDECACATANVHVRDGIGTSANILSTLPNGDCLLFKGDTGTDTAGSSWVNVDYNGQVE